MSKTVYSERVELKLNHFFEDDNVYNLDFINLSVGAPGKDLLSRCCSMFEKSTEHRMVIIVEQEFNI